MGEVLVVGSSNTDLVCRTRRIPRTGETVRGSAFATYGGGKGANQAIAARRAGAAVRFVGAIGDDHHGSERRDELAAEGIDVTQVRVAENVPSGVALITVEDSGDNSIVVVPGANGVIRAADATREVARGLHDILSLTLEVPIEVVGSALSANPASSRSILNFAPFDVSAIPLLKLVDILVCNEIEASELIERRVTVENAGECAGVLLSLGPKSAVITLGEGGAVAANAETTLHVAAAPVSAIDTTGAGDAFCGAFAALLSEGAELLDAVRWGVAAGSLAVTRAGAQPSLPHRVEIAEMLTSMGRA